MAAMIGTQKQQKDFKSRLGRIHAGGVNTSKHVYVGPVSSNAGKPEKKRKRGKAPTLTRPQVRKGPGVFTELFMAPIALVCGALAVLGARVVSYRYLTEEEFYTGVHFGIPGSIAAVVGLTACFLLLFRAMFGLKTPVRSRAMLTGIGLMAVFENMAVVRMPEMFATLYSDSYVSQVIAQFG